MKGKIVLNRRQPIPLTRVLISQVVTALALNLFGGHVRVVVHDEKQLLAA